ncbi:glutamate--tRNA ligase [Patescibacteria group bacterium]|nr:glutamate--tRNA ligase [Patescibacteria group bacterium]
MSKVVTRFAPSPTGFMHVGGVRTALFAWLYARKNGGKFILRIEDTDKAREVEGSIAHIIESLKWLGIEWDEGPDIGGPHAPYLQSDRLATYKEYALKLIEKGYAYPDPFTEAQVEEWRKQAEAEKRPFLFREHRPETMEEWDGKRPLRFKVPEVKRYEWEDLAWGTLSAGEEALDDFILIKGDGYPTYNFAHIVDDLLMEVTHIVRGQEFISSTPKFLSLYDALGIARPHFATMPIILGEAGTKKLGKRDGAKDILEYREEGYLPEAMMNFLALLGWHPESGSEILSREDLLASFDLARVQKGGARFDEEKLLHINREWMRTLSSDDYVTMGNLSAAHPERLTKIVPILKERAQTFKEAREMLHGELRCLFEAPTLDIGLLTGKEGEGETGTTKGHLEAVKGLVEGLHEGADPEAVKAVLMPYADEKGRAAVLWPTRYALSGAERSPDPFTLISVLGKEETLLRLTAAIDIL